MTPICIGLPTDRSGVYGLCQDWLQAHGIGTYEPHRRYGDGTLFNEWLGPGNGFNIRPSSIELMRQQPVNMVLHVTKYYWATKPIILRRAIPDLPAMRARLASMGVPHPWIMIDEPPHKSSDPANVGKWGWTQQIESDVRAFVAAATDAGFEVGVCVPGPSQYAFWASRLEPSWWILHASANWTGIDTRGCWLYNAETYTHLAAQLQAAGATGFLQWSGVKTTRQGPVPILFDAAGAPTEAAWELVRQLEQAQGPARTVEVRLTDLERRVAALES